MSSTVQFMWCRNPHQRMSLLCNGVPVASVACSGTWGWYCDFIDKLVPAKLDQYYAKRETAMRNVERRFKIPQTEVVHEFA